MAKVKLYDSEFAQLMKYKTQIGKAREQVLAIQSQADKQIAQLIAQGDELRDVLNTSWLAASRRVMLEDPDFKVMDMDIPACVVNEEGQQVVKLNAADKTAEWESVHDVKRIASEEPVQQECEEEKDNGSTE